MLLKILFVGAWLAMTIAGSVLQPVKEAKAAVIRAEPRKTLHPHDFDRLKDIG
jgi:hypothetical protein